MRFLLALFALLFTAAAPAAFAQDKAQAVFAGGCFWCMESDMSHIPGVISVESGYTGGKDTGRFMKEWMAKYKGLADGKLVQDALKTLG